MDTVKGVGICSFLICLVAIALRAVLLSYSGMRLEEAYMCDIYGIYPGMPWSAVLADIPLQQPGMHILMRIAGILFTPSLIASRAIPFILGAWSLLLIRGITRRISGENAAVWAVTLAALSWIFIDASVALVPTGFTLWAILLLQWAFIYALTSTHRSRTLVYLICLLIALSISPHIRALSLLQAMWALGTVIFSRNTQKKSTSLIIAIAAGIIVILLSLPPFGDFSGMFLFNEVIARIGAIVRDMYLWTFFSREMSLIPPGQYVVYGIAIGVTVCLVVGLVHTIVTRRSDLYLLVVACVALPVLATLLPQSDSIEYIYPALVVALPFWIILCAVGFSSILLLARRAYAYIPLRALRIGACVVAFVAFFALLTGWMILQYHTTYVWRHACGARDISLATRFLSHVFSTNDTFAVVSDTAPQGAPLLRFYAAPFMENLSQESAVISPGVWRHMTLTPSPSDTHAWYIGAPLSPSPLQTNITSVYLPFATPVGCVLPHDATYADVLEILYSATRYAPYAHAVTRTLIDWYRTAPEIEIQDSILRGFAARDLRTREAIRRHDRYWRRAVNRPLYVWSEMSTNVFTCETFPAFTQYAYAIRGAEVDVERVVRIYRYYIEHGLATTNITATATALAHARVWDENNPFLLRHTAEWYAQKDPTSHTEQRRYNRAAQRAYHARFNRPFIDAWMARVLLEEAAGDYDAALQECTALYTYLTEEARAPETLLTFPSDQRKDWENTLRFWETQCHTVLARLYFEMGDENSALYWQKLNSEEDKPVAHRRVAYERLADMYLRLGQMDEVFDAYDALYLLADTSEDQIRWRMEQALLAVTLGDTVRAYELWENIAERISRLLPEDRRAWSRDKRYQRIMRHIERRTGIDIRDAAITALRRRADRRPEKAPEYLRNAAQLLRNKLQYNEALRLLDTALDAAPNAYDVHLDKAFLLYRLMRYPAALDAFVHVQNAGDHPPEIRYDWRYRILTGFAERQQPPPYHMLIDWADTHRDSFPSAAAYYNFCGNIYIVYDMYDQAIDMFTSGIEADASYQDNFLDLGYIFSLRGDEDAAADMLDTIDANPLIDAQNVQADWRYIQMHYVSIRPYTLHDDE